MYKVIIIVNFLLTIKNVYYVKIKKAPLGAFLFYSLKNIFFYSTLNFLEIRAFACLPSS